MNERFIVRPMTTADADVVIEAFHHLSPESLRYRFFSPIQRITAGVAADLVLVDPATRIVLLAFDEATGALAGGVRVVRHRDDPRTADVAVTVGDRYQRHGLGSRLLRRVARAAQDDGVERLTGHVLVDNPAGRGLLIKNGALCRLDEPGVLAFEIPLHRPAPARNWQPRQQLSAAAAAS
jgi:RimJ/RimL family protein N-acetyltransferase